MTTSDDTLWMTKAALERLEQELAELTAAGRALDDRDEERARELRDRIRRAEVGLKPDDGLVEPGMRVTVRFETDGSTETFLFGSRELAGLDESVDVDVYSPASPLGRAIAGRYVGDAVDYRTPNDAVARVTVLAAAPFGA